MKLQHREQADGKWMKMSLVEQLANIGSDVLRAISWQKKGNMEYSRLAFLRSIELLDLSISDCKNHGSALKELCRLREVIGDYFLGGNQYHSTEKNWQNYFYAFTWLARK